MQTIRNIFFWQCLQSLRRNHSTLKNILQRFSRRTIRETTAFPLLKCLSTHCVRYCEPFYRPKMKPDCKILHRISKFSGGDIPRHPQKHSPMLAPRHQFPRGSPAFPLFLFYETITGKNRMTTNSSYRGERSSNNVSLKFR